MQTLEIEKLADSIADLNTRISALENARQPQISDWYDWNIALFSYFSNNVIAVSEIDATDFFQVGDRIRITQDGGYKFFYVVKVESSVIYLDAGSDYTFTSAAFSSIASSRLPQPAGFPGVFEYVPVLQSSISHIVSDQGSRYGNFSLNGGLVTVTSSRINATITPNTAGIIYETLPLPALLPSDTPSGSLMYSTVTRNNRSVSGFVSFVDIDENNTERVVISDIFTSGSGLYGHSFTITYPLLAE